MFLVVSILDEGARASEVSSEIFSAVRTSNGALVNRFAARTEDVAPRAVFFLVMCRVSIFSLRFKRFSNCSDRSAQRTVGQLSLSLSCSRKWGGGAGDQNAPIGARFDDSTPARVEKVGKKEC